MLACFPNGIAKITTISELPNIFAHFFRKILSKMFCRPPPAVESSALLRFSSLFSLLCFFLSVYLFSVSLVCFPFYLSLFSVFCPSLPKLFCTPSPANRVSSLLSLRFHVASHTYLHVAHRLTFIPLLQAHFFLSD